MSESQKHYTNWYKLDGEDYIWHDTIYMNFPEKYMYKIRKISSCLGWGWEDIDSRWKLGLMGWEDWFLVENWDDGNIPKLDCGDDYTKFTKNHWILYSPGVKFTGFKLYLNKAVKKAL